MWQGRSSEINRLSRSKIKTSKGGNSVMATDREHMVRNPVPGLQTSSHTDTSCGLSFLFSLPIGRRLCYFWKFLEGNKYCSREWIRFKNLQTSSKCKVLQFHGSSISGVLKFCFPCASWLMPSAARTQALDSWNPSWL
jgi:hypothetical protein